MSDKMHHAMKRRFSISLDYGVKQISAEIFEACRTVWVWHWWVAVYESNDEVSPSVVPKSQKFLCKLGLHILVLNVHPLLELDIKVFSRKPQKLLQLFVHVFEHFFVETNNLTSPDTSEKGSRTFSTDIKFVATICPRPQTAKLGQHWRAVGDIAHTSAP